MRFKVALIGCGNLGSRHLQALKKTQKELSITVCEPFENSREIALQRYNEIQDNSYIEAFSIIEKYTDIDADTDLVIIATSSAERFQIAKWIVNNISIKYIILEKVVFQSISELEEFNCLLRNKKGVKGWVNCPRRMFRFYKLLKEEFKKYNEIDMIVSGTDWGMGCNSIHMLDLYEYVTGSSLYVWNNDGLESYIGDSKRHGYKEFYGEMDINTDKGKVYIVCKRNEVTPFKMVFKLKDMIIDIQESKKEALYSTYDGELIKKVEIDFLPQSCLTNTVVEQLIETGSCDLTSYSDSMRLHKVILECFLSHMNKFEEREIEKCPIT